MRRAVVALLGMLALSAGASPPEPIAVNIEGPMQPGVVKQLGSYHLNASALDRMAAEDPNRYAKVSAILDAAARPPCESDATRMLKTSEDLERLHCTALILTSHPAQRHVYFVLEGVAYSSRVVMTYEQPKLRKVEP